jgi:anti-anti-sigma factor
VPMEEPPLEIVGSDGVFTLRGELDMATADQLSEIVEGSTGTLVLDLEGVTFINSSGLQAVLTAQKAARKRGAELVLRRPSRVVHRVLELASMTETFVIEE